MPSLSADKPRFDCFAQCAPGLEPITARELKGLGRKPHKDVGGASFRADLHGVYGANLWLRTASRVVVRMGRFHASSFYELERRAKKLPWENFLAASGSVSVRVTSRKSRLYHSDAVAERVLAAIARVAPAGLDLRQEHGADDEEIESGDGLRSMQSQLFVVRILHDECEVSADSSGELLHRRGYRQEVGRAPLRETLAAAMILASQWKRGEVLFDPMCGSGTIPIEAALIARNIAPGLRRDFAFMHWPTFDEEGWKRMVEGARESGVAEKPAISGADRDKGAIEAARRNAERAGVGESVLFEEASLSETISRLPEGGGWILTNPPYGVRVGDTRALRNLFATLGNALRRTEWRLGILSADDALASQIGVVLRERFATRNGGIPVSFLVTQNGRSEGAK